MENSTKSRIEEFEREGKRFICYLKMSRRSSMKFFRTRDEAVKWPAAL
jgi:hypothetical protein